MGSELLHEAPLDQERESTNGLGIVAWRDQAGRRFYIKREAARLLGVTPEALHKRGVASFKHGNRAFVDAEAVDDQRSRLLAGLGALDTLSSGDAQDLEEQLAAERRKVSDLELEVAGLVADLRGIAATEDVWKSMALRRLPEVIRHD